MGLLVFWNLHWYFETIVFFNWYFETIVFFNWYFEKALLVFWYPSLVLWMCQLVFWLRLLVFWFIGILNIGILNVGILNPFRLTTSYYLSLSRYSRITFLILVEKDTIGVYIENYISQISREWHNRGLHRELHFSN